MITSSTTNQLRTLFLFSLVATIFILPDPILCKKKLQWFKAHNLSCRFCTKKSQIFGLLPETLDKVDSDHQQGSPHHHRITIQRTGPPKCRLDKRFLSFSLDTLELKRNLRCFPLASQKINNLVRALSPAYIRIGGTPQDFLIFADDNSDSFNKNTRLHHLERINNHNNKVDARKQQRQQHQPDQNLPSIQNRNLQKKRNIQNRNIANPKTPNWNCKPSFENFAQMKKFHYTRREFQELFNFTQRNNLRLIFGLNGLTNRDQHGKWNPNQATKSILREYSDRVDWEIGNEPNRFNKYGRKSVVKPRQLARDTNSLRAMLNNAQAMIYGPDIAKPSHKALNYLKKFLMGRPSIDAVTYHLYEMHRTVATLDQFMNPMYAMKIEEEMGWIDSIVKSTRLANTTDIWVGETGSASGGGAPGLSDRFVSGFHYLSKVGLAAEFCHKVVIRQSLYGGYYGMLDPVTHDPLPDYWITVLFKKLIKNIVLSSLETTTGGGATKTKDQFFRTQVYCSRQNSADVVISFVNMKRMHDYTFTLDGFGDRIIKKYVFTNANDLQSKSIYLNNVLLELSDDYKFPAMKGVRVKQPVLIPRASYGFLVVKNVQSDACK